MIFFFFLQNWANIIRKHDTISEIILGEVFQEQTAFGRTVIEKRNAGAGSLSGGSCLERCLGGN